MQDHRMRSGKLGQRLLSGKMSGQYHFAHCQPGSTCAHEQSTARSMLRFEAVQAMRASVRRVPAQSLPEHAPPCKV